MAKLYFDIGAYKGQYTDEYLAAGASVVAVEPQHAHAEALRVKYQGAPVTVVEAAAGASPGVAVLYSAGPSWFAALRPERWKSGRFSAYQWHSVGKVDIVTLDRLIDEYGMPDFIKIDTEGGEPEALLGLTKPVPALSYEFTGELLDDTERCGQRLSEIGGYEYAISYTHDDKPGDYMPLDEVMAILRNNKTPLLWGNIYARLKDGD